MLDVISWSIRLINIKLIFFLVAYAALSVSCFVYPTRPWIALLETTTFCTIAFSIVACFTVNSTAKPFWIGFAITSFLWLFLHHGYPNREFYSLPGTIGEYSANPTELYHDWSGV